MSAQLAFRWDARISHGRTDFVVSAGNAAPVGLIEAWPDWPGRTLALCGPAGCGKSHLANVWADEIGDALRLPLDGLTEARVSRLTGAEHILIDDAGVPVEEAALFHLLNLLKSGGGSLLMAARTAPARWKTRLPDLASRLRAVTVAQFDLPDDDLLAALLHKHFRDRQLDVADAVVRFLVPRMIRSGAEAARLAEALDAEALARGQAVTVRLAGEVLAAHDAGT
ncbi:MAG: hypothetical protein LPL00_10785 [Alphaproteobacteria bacterium]|nr:hypothetical protein [Alphaproteobacteria bacterium]MDX5370169.1 hypothetical protein [Alphaproteobacteria bacterium]MDX5464731.1 hypothetical protein [Alphaproteobacteria bacterium]